MPLGRSGPTNCSPAGRKGKNLSVKYTSDELTTRPMLGTHTRYDPGDNVLRPKVYSDPCVGVDGRLYYRARGLYRVCAAADGHDAHDAWLPRPSVDWKLVSVQSGGPVVRLSTSTACCTMWGQNETGSALATKWARV